MGDVLISVKGVGKKFCRNLRKSLWYGLCDAAASVVHGQEHRSEVLRKDEFWAVEDVSFEVKRGECIGLIGKNGAGKTTILKMLNGLILPDRGKIDMRGRVGGLIALGAGFNPLLTGRENVFVNGAILGMSRRSIAACMDEIAVFADIGAFMDAPVQSYSSGMSVRLGFAIAVVLVKPDILLLDEVLAVGDMGFVIKCLNAVRELARDCAVVFVSHNMQFVSSFCTHVLVLTQGKVHTDTASVAEGMDAYMRLFPMPTEESGSGGASFSSVVMRQSEGEIIDRITQGEHATLDFQLQCAPGIHDTSLSVYVMDQAQTPIICYPDIPHALPLQADGSRSASIRISLGMLDLNAGRYSFVLALTEKGSARCLCRQQGISPFQVTSTAVHWGSIVRTATPQTLSH